ncbi:potassium transporter [Providencia rettgeri]|nr:potassium transporter [Providencia rettgeri]
MHFRAITRIVGLLVIIFSFTMVIPGIVALIYRDGAGRAFSQTFVTALLIGLFCGYQPVIAGTNLKQKKVFLLLFYFGLCWEALGHCRLFFRKGPIFR